MSSSPPEKFLLKTVLKAAKNKKLKLYIVGGYLRDILLNREKDNPDIDFCLKKNAIGFGKHLAKEIRAGFVVLDKEHGACRLVKRIKERTYTLDFTDFRAKNLEDDLLHRDFTINALALGLTASVLENNCLSAGRLGELIIDPYGGRKDLDSGIIRLVNNKGFDEDPLRILRAFSFSATLGFRIDRQALGLSKIKKDGLSEVSSERIRDEFFKILDTPCAYEYLVKMDEIKILGIILPEIRIMRNIKQGPYHHLDVWKHTLETVKQLEMLIKELKNNREIRDYLNEVISPERRRRSLMKLGALLHDVGKPAALRHEDGKTMFHGHERIGLEITENAARRLRLSNDELESLRKMVLWHLRPGYLADNQELTERARFRYFRDSAQEGVSILLISIADQRATKGPLASRESRMHHEEVVLGLVREYFRKKKQKKPPRIINGDDLLKKFKLEPSPLIGRILSEIEEAQAIGKIRTRKAAFGIAKRTISDAAMSRERDKPGRIKKTR